MTTSDQEQRLVVSPGEAGSRLDVFLAKRLPALSRSQIQRLIRTGQVTAGTRAIKAGTLVSAGLGLSVRIPPAAPANVSSEPLPLSILHEDEDVVVIEKPAGMVVHPSAGHPGGTLVNALLHHVKGLSGIGGTERPGIVHRLDRGTSGVMVVAKNDRAHHGLAQQFRDRSVSKEYIALVWGMAARGLTMAQAIGRDSRDRRKMSSRSRRARTALTTVLGVEQLTGVSLVRLGISTGRTHQIRVHLSEAGHPVVGDAVYGGVRRRLPAELAAVDQLDRPFLHAARLQFTHPVSGNRLSFEAALPEDLAQVLSVLRRVRAARRS